MSANPNQNQGGGNRRSRRNRSNGKSIDEVPQLMSFPLCSQTGANTYAEVIQALPMTQLISQQGKFYVIEILKIWLMTQYPVFAAATNIAVTAQVSKAAIGAISNFSNLNVIGLVQQQIAYPAVMANNASEFCSQFAPMMIDFTDGKGNGILFAGKNLYLGFNTVNAGGTMWAAAKMLWRLKLVTADELLGLTQE